VHEKHFAVLGGWADLEGEKRASVTDLLTVGAGAAPTG
jgi:hypothetical protein